MPLYAGRAGVPGLRAGELPDDPVGRLDPPLGPLVDPGRLVQQLQGLGELPFGGDLPAVPGQPRLAAFGGQLVDPVRVPLGRVVLPELDVGVLVALQLVELAERGPVGQHREHGARGEVGADADDLLRPDPGVLDRRGHGGPQRVPVVFRVLQRPVRGERLAGGGELGVHDLVGVLVDRRAGLAAVTGRHDERPGGQRAEVHPDDVLVTPRLLIVSANGRHVSSLLLPVTGPPPG